MIELLWFICMIQRCHWWSVYNYTLVQWPKSCYLELFGFVPVLVVQFPDFNYGFHDWPQIVHMLSIVGIVVSVESWKGMLGWCSYSYHVIKIMSGTCTYTLRLAQVTIHYITAFLLVNDRLQLMVIGQITWLWKSVWWFSVSHQWC